MVRVMHPEKGMGVEFAQASAAQREALKKFLGLLKQDAALQPELLVQPDGLESEPANHKALSGKGPDDPLLRLFMREALAPHVFHEELQKHRAKSSAARAAGASHP